MRLLDGVLRSVHVNHYQVTRVLMPLASPVHTDSEVICYLADLGGINVGEDIGMVTCDSPTSVITQRQNVEVGCRTTYVHWPPLPHQIDSPLSQTGCGVSEYHTRAVSKEHPVFSLTNDDLLPNPD